MSGQCGVNNHLAVLYLSFPQSQLLFLASLVALLHLQCLASLVSITILHCSTVSFFPTVSTAVFSKPCYFVTVSGQSGVSNHLAVLYFFPTVSTAVFSKPCCFVTVSGQFGVNNHLAVLYFFSTVSTAVFSKPSPFMLSGLLMDQVHGNV